MDDETFETLAEALAFECADKPHRSRKFSDIFYGAYKNSGPSFLNVDASMGKGSTVTMVHAGRVIPGYIMNCEWSIDERRSHMGLAPGQFRVRLEILAKM